jgi:hypothetical protein
VTSITPPCGNASDTRFPFQNTKVILTYLQTTSFARELLTSTGYRQQEAGTIENKIVT